MPGPGSAPWPPRAITACYAGGVGPNASRRQTRRTADLARPDLERRLRAGISPRGGLAVPPHQGWTRLPARTRAWRAPGGREQQGGGVLGGGAGYLRQDRGIGVDGQRDRGVAKLVLHHLQVRARRQTRGWPRRAAARAASPAAAPTRRLAAGTAAPAGPVPLTFYRREPARPASPVGPRPAPRPGQGQGLRPARSGRSALPQLPRPARAPGHLDPQPGPVRRNRTTVPVLAEPTSTQRDAFDLIGAPIPLTLR
jgi:hypothetical protein